MRSDGTYDFQGSSNRTGIENVIEYMEENSKFDKKSIKTVLG